MFSLPFVNCFRLFLYFFFVLFLCSLLCDLITVFSVVLGFLSVFLCTQSRFLLVKCILTPFIFTHHSHTCTVSDIIVYIFSFCVSLNCLLWIWMILLLLFFKTIFIWLHGVLAAMCRIFAASCRIFHCGSWTLWL